MFCSPEDLSHSSVDMHFVGLILNNEHSSHVDEVDKRLSLNILYYFHEEINLPFVKLIHQKF